MIASVCQKSCVIQNTQTDRQTDKPRECFTLPAHTYKVIMYYRKFINPIPAILQKTKCNPRERSGKQKEASHSFILLSE